MKFENRLFFVNLIPVIILFLFAGFMCFYLNGGFDALFSGIGEFTEGLSGDSPGDGYVLIGGLALGGLAAFGAILGMLIFVLVPIVMAFYILLFLIIGRLCMLGEKTNRKIKLCKIFTCLANLANVILVLFSTYQLFIQLFESGINAFLYIIPIAIFGLPLIYTIRQVFFVKDI